MYTKININPILTCLLTGIFAAFLYIIITILENTEVLTF